MNATQLNDSHMSERVQQDVLDLILIIKHRTDILRQCADCDEDPYYEGSRETGPAGQLGQEALPRVAFLPHRRILNCFPFLAIAIVLH